MSRAAATCEYPVPSELARALRRTPRPSVVSFPVPEIRDPSGLLESLPAEPAFAWFSPRGETLVGCGTAATFTASGSRRIEDVRGQLMGWFSQLDSTVRPRAFGGLAFATGGTRDPIWAGFGDADFVVPRWTYESVDGVSRFIVVIGSRADDQVLDEWRRIERSFSSDVRSIRQARVARIDEPSREHWQSYVHAIQSELGTGRVSKVVAAQRTEVGFDRPVDAPLVLDRLRRAAPGTTCFALRIGNATWVGATPERLVTRRGSKFETEALAGSIGAREVAAAEVLRSSSKNRAEHDFVVDAVLDNLRPLAEQMAAEPIEIKELPHLLHLRTPIAGRLRPGVDVFDLVDALHPTPAVGGFPRQEALELISAHEASARGWYAGPVGWVDADGDGEFVVALRSGLIRDRKAYVYAGSGIVSGSDASGEYSETMLKRLTVFDALRSHGGEERPMSIALPAEPLP